MSAEDYYMRRGVIDRLEQRNRLAQALIDSYGTKHAFMDVGVGLVGLIPGLGIPALLTSLGAQVSVIYQPLARDLAHIYLTDSDRLGAVSGVTPYVPYVLGEAGLLIAADVAGDFGAEFIKEIAGELILAMGAGAASTFIPVLGALFSAGLDYAIAKKITACVGRMVSIRFQSGMLHNFDRKETYRTAKSLDCSLDDIRTKVPDVNRALVRTVRLDVESMRESGVKDDAIRQILCKREVPDDIVDAALERRK